MCWPPCSGRLVGLVEVAEVEGDVETAVAFAELFTPEILPLGLGYHSRILFSNMTCRDHICNFLGHNDRLDILSFSLSLHLKIGEGRDDLLFYHVKTENEHPGC